MTKQADQSQQKQCIRSFASAFDQGRFANISFHSLHDENSTQLTSIVCSAGDEKNANSFPDSLFVLQLETFTESIL